MLDQIFVLNKGIHSHLPLIAGLFLLVLSAFLFIRRSSSRSVLAFAVLCFVLAVWQFDLYGLYILQDVEHIYIWRRIPRVFTYLIPPIVLNWFYTIIGKNKKSFLFISVWIVGICFAIARFIFYKGETYNRISDAFVPTLTPMILLWLFFLFSVSFYSLAILYIHYKHSQNQQEKLQIKYFIIAGMALSFLNLDSIIATMGFRIITTGSFATVVFALIISYAILKHRLMEIEVVIKKVTYFTLLIFIITVPFYYGVDYVNERLYMFLGHKSFVISALPWAILILVLDRLKLFIQKITDKIFFMAEYKYDEELSAVTARINQIVDIEVLVKTFRHEIVRVVKVDNVGLFILDRQKTRYRLFFSERYRSAYIDKEHTVIKRLSVIQDGLLEYFALKKEPDRDIIGFMDNHKSRILIACKQGDVVEAAVSLGDKKSGKVFSRQDISFVAHVLDQVVLILARIYEIEEKAVIRTEKELETRHSRELEAKNKLLQQQNIELKKAHLQISEQETRLIQQERFAVLGDVVAGVAHEINTPVLAVSVGMNYINGYVEKLRMCFEGKLDKQVVLQDKSFVIIHEDYQADATSIFVALDRIRAHIRNLKSFIRFQEKDHIEFDVNRELATTIDIISFKLPSNVELDREFMEGLPFIRGNAAEINQVFMNIIVNAIEAVPKGKRGTIKVRTYQDKDGIVIDVKDNGMGISKADQKRVFHEKFTTKKDKGTGLGLTICKEIILRHKGKVEVESVHGIGTVFRIHLPIVI